MKFIFHCLNMLAGIGIFLGLIIAALLINGRYWNFGACVKLPNGVIVAREAYLNFTKPYFRPNVVVKGPHGTIFSSGNDELFYFSQTTAWWVDVHPGDFQNFYNFFLGRHPSAPIRT